MLTAGIKPSLWSRPDRSLAQSDVAGARAFVEHAFASIQPAQGAVATDASVHARLVILRGLIVADEKSTPAAFLQERPVPDTLEAYSGHRVRSEAHIAE